MTPMRMKFRACLVLLEITVILLWLTNGFTIGAKTQAKNQSSSNDQPLGNLDKIIQQANGTLADNNMVANVTGVLNEVAMNLRNVLLENKRLSAAAEQDQVGRSSNYLARALNCAARFVAADFKAEAQIRRKYNFAAANCNRQRRVSAAPKHDRRAQQSVACAHPAGPNSNAASLARHDRVSLLQSSCRNYAALSKRASNARANCTD